MADYRLLIFCVCLSGMLSNHALGYIRSLGASSTHADSPMLGTLFSSAVLQKFGLVVFKLRVILGKINRENFWVLSSLCTGGIEQRRVFLATGFQADFLPLGMTSE